jgi:glucose-6-phosphate 1-epimerase
VHSQGHDSLVVWNPWAACASNFVDMEAADYTRMLCVETALTQGLVLEPGDTPVLTQIIG